MTKIIVRSSIAIGVFATSLVAACAGETLDVGTERAKRVVGASTETCPIEKCQQPFAEYGIDTVVAEPVSADGTKGGHEVPYPADYCGYYEGVKAPSGQWWTENGSVAEGWSVDRRLPGVVTRPGKRTNVTCVPSISAGQGSVPADRCDWRFLCEPAPDPIAACKSAPPPTSPAPASLVGTWMLDSFDTKSSVPEGDSAVRHITVAKDRPILAVTFAADGTWTAASCGSADRFDACSAWCERGLTCAAGSYGYAAGKLTSTIGNHGTQTVATTPSGITIADFYDGLEAANFVKIDALPPCQ